MALEPAIATADAGPNPELADTVNFKAAPHRECASLTLRSAHAISIGSVFGMPIHLPEKGNANRNAIPTHIIRTPL